MLRASLPCVGDISDPFSTQTVNGTIVRTMFPGNIIPAEPHLRCFPASTGNHGGGLPGHRAWAEAGIPAGDNAYGA